MNTSVNLKEAINNILIEYSVLIKQFFVTLSDSQKGGGGGSSSSSKESLDQVFANIVQKDKVLQQLVDNCMYFMYVPCVCFVFELVFA